jgi:hypothetical protein
MPQKVVQLKRIYADDFSDVAQGLEALSFLCLSIQGGYSISEFGIANGCLNVVTAEQRLWKAGFTLKLTEQRLVIQASVA